MGCEIRRDHQCARRRTIGIGQFRRGVAQSERELEWKQAEMARTLSNAMLKDEGWQAMTMLDWAEGRDYEITQGRVRILPKDIPVAIAASLRVDGPKRTETQRFITDRFDRFLFLVSQLQSAVDSGLVQKEDVRFPLEWYSRETALYSQEAPARVHGQGTRRSSRRNSSSLWMPGSDVLPIDKRTSCSIRHGGPHRNRIVSDAAMTATGWRDGLRTMIAFVFTRPQPSVTPGTGPALKYSRSVRGF